MGLAMPTSNTFTATYNAMQWVEETDVDEFEGMVHQWIAIQQGWGMDYEAKFKGGSATVWCEWTTGED